MAATVVSDGQRATPFSVVLTATGDDVANPDVVGSVELLGYCAAGPLKAFLTRLTDWSTLNLGGVNCDKVHVHLLADNTATGSPEDTTLTWATGPNTLSVGVSDSVGAAATTIKIEIRLSHSMRY